jgi:hypothetical protein
MIINNFRESELEQKSNKLVLLANLVDEILRLNASNWEEKKFLSYQDLTEKCTESLMSINTVVSSRGNNWMERWTKRT